ncbi:hypothetical protein [Mycoplasmoides pirum]|uniref:hypothetical protein n=1 Tax=Mycoplasmoides pirum TaxID=2122 RepID=UPI00048934A9|nr:hypothetical protein [Mycoplasmoides pirum]
MHGETRNNLSLLEKFENKEIKQTETNQKLTIAGSTEVYPVYSIPIKFLYLNDSNDRISTDISKLKSNEKENNHFNSIFDNEERNKIIEKFIEKSSDETFKKTKEDIKIHGQMKPGVVLDDGRVIDGNRRLSCIRQLNRENINNFGEFQASIITKKSITEKDIKIFELSIQFGEDRKVEYNPIEKLSGIYDDIVKNKIISVEDYAQSVKKTVKSIEEEVEISKLIVDFLEFINCNDNQFYIAKELAIDGPIREINKIISKIDDKTLVEKIKRSCFMGIIAKPQNDLTRYIRDFKKIAHFEKSESFFQESDKLCKNFLEVFPPEIKEIEEIEKIRNENKNIVDEFSSIVTTALDKANFLNLKTDSVREIKTIFKKLENFNDPVIFAGIKKDLDVFNQFNEIIDKTINLLEKIKKNITNV